MSYLPLYDEKDIISQVATGSEAAFGKLFQHYHQILGTYVQRFTRSREFTEDVVQDVFMKIWVNRAALASVTDFKAYLFVLSRNHVINCLKKQAKENLTSKSLDDVLQLRDFQDALPDNSYYKLIDEGIDQLPPQQQKVYLMSRHERLKYSEIASSLNISRETVKKYLQISSNFISTYVRNKLINRAVIIFIYFFS